MTCVSGAHAATRPHLGVRTVPLPAMLNYGTARGAWLSSRYSIHHLVASATYCSLAAVATQRPPFPCIPRANKRGHLGALAALALKVGTPDVIAPETVRLQADYAELFGLQPRVSFREADIQKAFQQMSAAELESGYSPIVRQGKMELLAFAKSKLLERKGRPASVSASIDVPIELLPTALALLAEVGEGCKCMAAALAVLQGAGGAPLAPQLALDIRLGLASLRPARMLEALAATLPGAGAGVGPALGQRATALAELRAMVLEAEGAEEGEGPAGSGGALTAEVAATALSHLTAAEVVALTDWGRVEKATWYTPVVAHVVAVAHVAAGFSERRPALVAAGASLLATAELPSADAALTQSVAALLLGDVAGALQPLDEAERLGPHVPSAVAQPTGPELPAAHQSRAYVRRAGGANSDPLPGLCMLAEMWLQQVAFPSFPDTQQCPPDSSLVTYFADPEVESTLSRLARTGALIAPPALHPLLRLGLSLPSGLLALAGGLALGLTAWAALSAARLGHRHQASPVAWATVEVSPSTSAAVLNSNEISESSAEQLLKRWEVLRIAALGEQHDTSALHTVLGGALLTSFTAQAERYRSRHWTVKYKSRSCMLTSVSPARVIAHVSENATVFCARGRPLHVLTGERDVELRVARSTDGAWRITGEKDLTHTSAVAAAS